MHNNFVSLESYCAIGISKLGLCLQAGVRDNATIMYNTSLGVIFGVKKYAERLLEVVKKKGIQLNYKHKLVEVNVPSKEAVFEVLEEDRTVTFKVSQITPTSH